MTKNNENNLKNKSNAKAQYWVTIIAYYFLYCVLVFGAAAIVIPTLGQVFLIYGWSIQGFYFLFFVMVFIITSSASIFVKIVKMVNTKSNIWEAIIITLISLPILFSMIPITQVVVNNDVQAKKLEYKINKIFCDKFPEECSSDNKFIIK